MSPENIVVGRLLSFRNGLFLGDIRSFSVADRYRAAAGAKKGGGKVATLQRMKEPDYIGMMDRITKILETSIPVKPKGVDMIQEERCAFWGISKYGGVLFPKNM